MRLVNDTIMFTMEQKFNNDKFDMVCESRDLSRVTAIGKVMQMIR